MEISREELYELSSVGVASEIILRVTEAAPDIVKSLKTPIRRLVAKNVALPYVEDVVTIMT